MRTHRHGDGHGTPTREPDPRGRRAFTITETIVTISIIVILLSLLVPVLSPAREAARRTACLANLRTLGEAVIMYRGDHDAYPVAPPVFVIPKGQTALLDVLITYVDAPRPSFDEEQDRLIVPAPFRCPSDSVLAQVIGFSYEYVLPTVAGAMRADGYGDPWVSLARGLGYGGEPYNGALFTDASPRFEVEFAGRTLPRHPRGGGASPLQAVFPDGRAAWADGSR